MPIPHKLSRKLHEILGNEAADAMADWMNQLDGSHSALRADIAELRHSIDVRFAQLTEEMRAGFAECDARFARLTEEMRVGFADTRVGFANADAKLSQRNFELMKWAFGFWIASLGMVTGALAVLSHFVH